MKTKSKAMDTHNEFGFFLLGGAKLLTGKSFEGSLRREGEAKRHMVKY